MGKKQKLTPGNAVYNCWKCENRWSAQFTEKMVHCPRCGSFKITRDV